jgi:hypothetical protein
VCWGRVTWGDSQHIKIKNKIKICLFHANLTVHDQLKVRYIGESKVGDRGEEFRTRQRLLQ